MENKIIKIYNNHTDISQKLIIKSLLNGVNKISHDFEGL